MSDEEEIRTHIANVRRLLGLCSMQLNPFDSEIQRVLALADSGAYGHIIDSYYLFEDTEAAKEYVRLNGLSNYGNQPEIGLAYLKFYGLMNACYMQCEAVLICAEKLGVNVDVKALKGSAMVQYRNDFAAHSPNRRNGKDGHSFIVDRFGLIEGRVSGYSSNAPGGIQFRSKQIAELLSDWDRDFTVALKSVSDSIGSRIRSASIADA